MVTSAHEGMHRIFQDVLALWFDRSLIVAAAEDLFAEDLEVPGPVQNRPDR
ncbi:hypothetical protein ACPYPG_23465 [Streptomyces sp. FR-108]|uniref:hypothetical protein n=1 Tax=Streptomyces sp. FR-108 TaxID=3416665 RepID=UPI003CF39E6A